MLERERKKWRWRERDPTRELKHYDVSMCLALYPPAAQSDLAVHIVVGHVLPGLAGGAMPSLRNKWQRRQPYQLQVFVAVGNSSLTAENHAMLRVLLPLMDDCGVVSEVTGVYLIGKAYQKKSFQI